VDKDRLSPDAEIDDFSGAVLRELSAQRSLRDITLTLHSTEFAVNRAVFQFLERGWVTLDRVLPSKPPPLTEPLDATTPPEELLERSRQRFDERAYAETVIIARQAIKGDPANSAARELLEQSEQELTDSYYARYFSRTDIPYLAEPPNPIDTALRSAEERFLLERINGEWPFRALIHLSPLKEVDAVAIFKKLIEEGVIAVRKGPASPG